MIKIYYFYHIIYIYIYIVGMIGLVVYIYIYILGQGLSPRTSSISRTGKRYHGSPC